MYNIFIAICVVVLVIVLTLQRKCWYFIWQLNGFRGIIQQPILWALIIFYVTPKGFLNMTSHWRAYFQRPLAIIVGTRIILYADDPYTIEQILNAPECLDKTFLQNGFFARKGLLHACGQQWRTRRKQLNPAFSHSILLGSFSIFNSVGNQLQYALTEKLKGATTKAVGVGDFGVAAAAVSFVDIEDLLSRAVLEVSCLTTLGAKTNFTKNDAAGIARAYKKLLEISALRIMKPWLQNDRLFRLLNQKNYEKYVESNKLVEQFVDDIVQRKHKAWLTEKLARTTESATFVESNSDGMDDGNVRICSHRQQQQQHGEDFSCNEHHFVGGTTEKRIFIEQIFHLATFGELTLEDILNETHAMILVSFETVSNSLIMALLLLAMHPDCQQNLRNEINTYFFMEKNVAAADGDVDDKGENSTESVNGNLHNINVTQLQQMKYLDMIVNESLRLLTTVPINLRHVSCDFRLQLCGGGGGGLLTSTTTNNMAAKFVKKLLVVPKDTIVVVDTFNMQRDENIWGTASKKFEPKQHFATNVDADVGSKRHPYAFIPFSKGLRSCIGTRYSMLLMKVFLVKLISEFEFSTQMQLKQLRFIQEISLKIQQADSINFQIRQIGGGSESKTA